MLTIILGVPLLAAMAVLAYSDTTSKNRIILVICFWICLKTGIIQKMQRLVDVAHVSFKMQQRLILDDINFSVKRGEIVTIIGPNGAGKTVLLKIILGLYQPTSGQVIRASNLRIGYMPQLLALDSLVPLNVQRFLMLSPRADLAKCQQVAADLGIANLLSLSMQTLSGGELQKVLLARALLNEPDLLVLDEPAHGIDINGQATLYKLLNEIRSKLGCGIILVSHDLHLVIAGTDHVICLNRHICCSGSPAAVTQNPEFIHLFGSKVAAELALYTHHHDHNHEHDHEHDV